MSFFMKGNAVNVQESLESGKAPRDRAAARRLNWPKSLKWHMATNDTLTRVTITPAMAEEMLAYNDRNRPVRAKLVQRYSDMMRAGKWRYTRVPIIFSDDPRLIDGQHRLAGVLESGASIEVDIVFGAPDDAFYFIDVGKPRSASDIFSINSVPNHAMAAAATRFLMAYQAERTTGNDGIGISPTLEEIYEAYCGFERLQESVHVGQRFASDRLPCPSICAAVHYLCAQKSRKAADEYFEKIYTGIGFSSRRDPAYKVREYLIRADDGTRHTQAGVAAALIEGWNAIRNKKPLGKIRAEKVGRVV